MAGPRGVVRVSNRLAAIMGRPGGPLAGDLADFAIITLDLLDVLEGDPEAEPDMDGEPSLGWSSTGATGTFDTSPFLLDLEEEHDGREWDPGEDGIGDPDGLHEQMLRARFGDTPSVLTCEGESRP